MLTLQINTSGSWKNVVHFENDKREEVLAGLTGLAQALGNNVTWCFWHHETACREWLHDLHKAMFPGWNDDPTELPPPLVDVLVSAWDASEGEGVVFMAWRSATQPDRWMISGSDEPLLLPVYAWGPIMAPHSDVPVALKAAKAEKAAA